MEYFWSQGVSKLNKKYFFLSIFFYLLFKLDYLEMGQHQVENAFILFSTLGIWLSDSTVVFFLFQKMRSQSTFKNCGAILVRADQISPNFWSPFYFLHFSKFLKNNYSIGQPNAQRLIMHKSLFVLALTQLEKIRFEKSVFFFSVF